MKKLEGLESLNESIKQAHEKLKTTYAEMANKGNITQMDKHTIKHSVKMALKESKNVKVIMSLCTIALSRILRIKMEKGLESINNLSTEGVIIGSMKIINAYRKQGRPRPLSIIFEEKT